MQRRIQNQRYASSPLSALILLEMECLADCDYFAVRDFHFRDTKSHNAASLAALRKPTLPDLLPGLRNNLRKSSDRNR
ncbi:MAG TPA: hypothetical protein VE689_10175, partial [Candidatus Udaeobacter sp.]|nr:hypothetical protein [Candidatus Udaeobacter sp.]